LTASYDRRCALLTMGLAFDGHCQAPGFSAQPTEILMQGADHGQDCSLPVADDSQADLHLMEISTRARSSCVLGTR
jgi:hypothetical protein